MDAWAGQCTRLPSDVVALAGLARRSETPQPPGDVETRQFQHWPLCRFRHLQLRPLFNVVGEIED